MTKLNIPPKLFLFWLAACTVIILSLVILRHKQTKLSEQMIPHMPKLNWNFQDEQITYALLESGTENERVIPVEGISITAAVKDYTPLEVYSYYNDNLTKSGYNKLSVIGEIETEKSWVTTYKKGQIYYEIQYYPTPYNEEESSIRIFLGKI